MGPYEFSRDDVIRATRGENGTYELIPGWIGSYRTWSANPIRETAGYEIAIRPVFDRLQFNGEFWEYVTIATYPGNGARMGIWTDPDTGIVYLDYTIHVANLEHALELGRTFGQLAVFDWQAMSAISINDNLEGN